MAPLPSILRALYTRAVPTSKPAFKDPNYRQGGFSIDPHHVNNRGYFALFALLGVAMVLAIIWFFFWAKNGGFHFRKGDWEDYKSTVLRRKGPDGKTLSGATKTTKLGGGSVVANEGEEYSEKGSKWRRGAQQNKKNSSNGESGKPGRGKKNNEDTDVRAYRHEKAARVGGLNRQADGVLGRDYAASSQPHNQPTAFNPYSDTASSAPTYSDAGDFVPINSPRKGGQKPPAAKTSKKASPETPKHTARNGGGRRDSIYETPGSNASTDSHRPLRSNAAPLGGGRSGTSTPTKSPRKSGVYGGSAGRAGDRGSMPGSFAEPLDFESRYSYGPGSEAGTEVSGGTKAYFHPIPGLGKNGGGGGWRRGAAGGAAGRGRRDSLSDSD
ncbi:uncharacterized protein KY384_002990 [Bacidia gigantensis]|uniref:uncharacterized protein n=1 Tax=Bacidia gigantensis TaxID=2732470 RepID=UPI001D050149|nr:uncharacterized protein KY384_002990 [Bacidia gigantensis]KAG8531361.1 hypothetical protein KY384_002990 [Bacidia gigantensis]